MSGVRPIQGRSAQFPVYERVTPEKDVEDLVDRTTDQERIQKTTHSSVAATSPGTSTFKSTTSTLLEGKPEARKPSKRKVKDAINDCWLWELGALLLSIAVFIVLIAILRHYEGKPTPRWPLHITINALISVCSMIVKGAMIVPVEASINQLQWMWFRRKKSAIKAMEVFDEASRGPMGSLALLTSRQARSLASLGAIITILSIAIDPFFQQIVNYPLRSVAAEPNSTQRASLLRAVRYEEIGPFDNEQNLAPEIPMQKAIYGSLFNGAGTMMASCPSGNCTWEVFTTLGVCNRCQNISHLIKESTVANPAYDPHLRDASIKNTSEYHIPNGLYVTLPTYVDPLGDYYPALIASNGTALLTSISSSPWTIANISIMSHLTAYECSLFWCLQSSNSTMTRGLLSETPLSNGSQTYDLYTGSSIQDTDRCTMYPQPISNAPFGPPTTGQPIYVSAPPNSSLPDSCITHLYPASSSTAGSFLFSSSAHTALQNFIAPLFTGNLTWQGLDSFDPSSTVLQSMIAYGNTNESIFSSNASIVSAASRASAGEIDLQDIPAIMNNLTSSMTMRMRLAAADDPNSTILGTVYETQAVVQIHWAWLTLPAFLLIGTTGFLGLVMRESSQVGMPAWKSSATAVLFHGLDAEVLERMNGSSAEKLSEMEEVAKKIEAKLVDTDRGWKLL